MTSGSLWMVAGLVLAGFEMLAPGVFIIWLGLAAFGAGIATELFTLALPGQVTAFLVLAAALIGLIALRRRNHPLLDTINAPAAGLIGQTCRAIAFQGPEGRVALGDGTWSARTTAPTPQPGQALRVTGLDGTTLLVTPL